MKLKIDDLGKVTLNIEDWNQNLQYPRLTLTTDYNTWITYISRKDVPAGVLLTDTQYWKPVARLSKDLALDYNNFKDAVNAKLSSFASLLTAFNQKLGDFNTQMQSFIATASGGEAFSNMMGNSEVMGVTQKSLTGIINNLYQLIADTLGIDMNGVEITITPDGFYKDNPATVNISAIADYGLFDFVKVYFNGVEVLEREGVQIVAEEFTISETTLIRVEAQVMGRLYTAEKTITESSDFFIGAGYSYEDVYKPEYSRPYSGNPSGQYNVQVADGQKLVIILPTADVSLIEQIEMNDFNIPMTTTEFGIYTAFVSDNTYQAGTYTIDINY